MSRNLMWEDHNTALPTLDGMSTGIVAVDNSRRPTLATAQCSACLRTATGELFWVVHDINFAADAYDDYDSRHSSGALKYRRCEDCRAADQHPKENR